MTTTPAAPATTLPAERGSCPFAPPPAYDDARRTEPVKRMSLWNGEPCWLVTGYEENRIVLQDRRFSADARNAGFPFLSPGRRQLLTKAQPSFLRLDDPEHARLRRMLTGDFIVKRAQAQQPQVQAIVDDVLDRMLAKGEPADLVRDFALPVPSRVICLLLGVPYADHEFFERTSSVLVDLTTPPDQVKQAQGEIRAYLDELVEAKRRHPDDTLLGKLVARGELSQTECAAMALVLLVAGHETTANMISFGMLALLRNPEQAALLRAEPERIGSAIEELLRYLSVVHFGLPRTTLEDVELGGQLIRAGEGVLCMISAANRDESLFTDPERFDITRDSRRHLAFGFGVHQCVGQPLARVELRSALGTLLRRLPDLRLAVPDDQLEYRTDKAVYGVREMPVLW
ncbi:cytochrome P450 [Amycolatopsis sp. NPDC059657]|uniref:cytochrome P450 n=1 Tax=Amycolatopsis sp. NPDC059657 TaxID=3346899 RepID=UPI00366EDE1F